MSRIIHKLIVVGVVLSRSMGLTAQELMSLQSDLTRGWGIRKVECSTHTCSTTQDHWMARNLMEDTLNSPVDLVKPRLQPSPFD
jgi:hypothetical protein